jgi:hypothetical protein
LLVIPFEPFHPDINSTPNAKDPTLKFLMEGLTKILEYGDVREFLIKSYNLRQIAINAKLL